MMQYFEPAPVYRLGGDPFVAWLDSQDHRKASGFSFMHPIKFALIDPTIVFEGCSIDEVCCQACDRICAGISEGTGQSIFINTFN